MKMRKIHYAHKDGLAVITLDDGKMNTMNWDFFSQLNEALDRTIADGAGALIFTGRKGVFSAGLDLKLLPTLPLEEQLRLQKTFALTMLRVYLFSVPTIAAYAGHSIAGGAILSYACDRFMAADGPYRIQINEVANKMLIPGWISLICRSSIPPRYWKEALLHSRAYTPREAFACGIVDDLIEGEDKVMEAATAVARDLCQLDGPAYAATKRSMRQREAEEVMNVFEKELLEWFLRSPK